MFFRRHNGCETAPHAEGVAESGSRLPTEDRGARSPGEGRASPCQRQASGKSNAEVLKNTVTRAILKSERRWNYVSDKKRILENYYYDIMLF